MIPNNAIDANRKQIDAQSSLFINRLTKRYKHLRKWAKRNGVTCYRLYDRDIPEIPLAVDLYEESGTTERYLQIALYERPYEKPAKEEAEWLDAMKIAAAGTLGMPRNHIFAKIRKKQRGEQVQYERFNSSGARIIIEENNLKFFVNLSDYLDTGIFLDHRPARMMVYKEAAARQVLNLFCYTGLFSVYAAAAGAKSVTSVDLSKTYLTWAAENLALNGFHATLPEESDLQKSRNQWTCIQADAKIFLRDAIRAGKKWDLIICDPPTFSNSKRTSNILDINRDWSELCKDCLSLLAPNGILYFSTNSRSLKFDAEVIQRNKIPGHITITDISEASIPSDFRNRNIHRLWKFTIE